jgi:FAD/FMN-containing dehydrogenase
MAMSAVISNYDGGITAHPRMLVRVKDADELCAVVQDKDRYPGPIRPMGSYHSLTPCASSDGTMIDMSGMSRIVEIDPEKMTMTAQAGLQWIDAAAALRKRKLQFLTNVEIGNMTVGAAACCHTKDGLDGVELGQVSSYATALKWVTPSGALAQASEASDPATLRMMRSSHGLAGVVYEATFRIKPLETIRFTYLPRKVDALTQSEVDDIIDRSPGLVCWTVGGTAIFQTRSHAERPGLAGPLFGAVRRRLWSRTGAHLGRFIDTCAPTTGLRNLSHDASFIAYRAGYSALGLLGGLALANPDKIIDYRRTPPAGKYAFTFWSFPRRQWLSTLREYLAFAEQHFKSYGFRCNLPLGSYRIRQDTSGILSYSHDGDTFSIDPIHAYSDKPAWDRFLQEFNEFAHQRNGVPLLNQTPFVEKKHVTQGYGGRWREFSDWVRGADPDKRMLNPFFASLLA